jgi:superfamily II RNA helicase
MTQALTSFRALYDFELDEFQLDACRALEDGHGVLVAAPTGSGKTIVGEFAVHLALAEGRKCFYTHQGTVEPEIRRPRATLRRRLGRSADR